MKKIYLLSSLFAALFHAKSQTATFEIKDTGLSTTYTNSSLFYKVVEASGTAENDFVIKNISASTQTYSLRRYDHQINTVSTNDKAQPYFCTGVNCFGTATKNATLSLAAGTTMTLRLELDEATATGESIIGYQLANPGNIGESFSLTIKYNSPSNPYLSVVEQGAVNRSFSGVYPNPCASSAKIKFYSGRDNSANLSISNTLGQVVSSKELSFQAGHNEVALDLEDLSNGVYFMTMSGNGILHCDKFVISR
jgi:hypothetical protein